MLVSIVIRIHTFNKESTMASILLERLSRSSSVMGSRDDQLDDASKVESIMVYVRIASSLATQLNSFDILSQINTPVRIDELLFSFFFVGCTYAFLDFFIKQYTGKLDFNETLNPMLKGVNYGIILQVYFWLAMFSTEAVYALQYLIASLSRPPTWSKCVNIKNMSTRCIPTPRVKLMCMRHNKTTINQTAVDAYYRYIFHGKDRGLVTEKTVISAFIWIVCFFLATLSAVTLMKVLKLWLYSVYGLTLFNALLGIAFTHKVSFFTSMGSMFKLKGNYNLFSVLQHLPFTHGIGMIGVYDFGCMSVYTSTDNAVIIYTLAFLFLSIVRSAVILIGFTVVKTCFLFRPTMKNRFKIFGITTVASDMIHLNKIYIVSIYLSLLSSFLVNITVLTATLGKLLQSEFRKLKEIYLVGFICILGFCGAQAMTTYPTEYYSFKKIAIFASLYLGAYKVIFVIYVYGMKKFVTDIEFLLGFKPVAFWKFGWIFLPIILIVITTFELIKMYKETPELRIILITWLSITAVIVVIIQIKTFISFILKNNAVGAFCDSKKYGPPDIELRKQRKHYDANARFRKCTHNCTPLDDRLDCWHESKAEEGLTHIYQEFGRKRSSSIALGVLHKQD